MVPGQPAPAVAEEISDGKVRLLWTAHALWMSCGIAIQSHKIPTSSRNRVSKDRCPSKTMVDLPWTFNASQIFVPSLEIWPLGKKSVFAWSLSPLRLNPRKENSPPPCLLHLGTWDSLCLPGVDVLVIFHSSRLWVWISILWPIRSLVLEGYTFGRFLLITPLIYGHDKRSLVFWPLLL